MSYFPWTDEMVKEMCYIAQKNIYFDHRSNDSEMLFDALIESYKEEKIKHIQGTFENKLYWAVNKWTLDIRPVNEMVDQEDAYFTSYTDALNYSNEKKKEKADTIHQRTING